MEVMERTFSREIVPEILGSAPGRLSLAGRKETKMSRGDFQKLRQMWELLFHGDDSLWRGRFLTFALMTTWRMLALWLNKIAFFPKMCDHYIGLATPADIRAQISTNKWEV